LISGNILGQFLDSKRLSLRFRSRWAFGVLTIAQGAWWLWGTILVTEFHKTQPVYDWSSPGFSKGFTWFLFQVLSFQLNYMYL
jgi:hypothetical protein